MTCHCALWARGRSAQCVGVNDRARETLELYHFLARLATGAHCACQASSYFSRFIRISHTRESAVSSWERAPRRQGGGRGRLFSFQASYFIECRERSGAGGVAQRCRVSRRAR